MQNPKSVAKSEKAMLPALKLYKNEAFILGGVRKSYYTNPLENASKCIDNYVRSKVEFYKT